MCSNQAMPPAKVAVCFWGITRNAIQTTLPTIKKHIYEPMEKAGIEYTVFLHTYLKHGVYSNRWAQESGITFDNEEWRLLEPHVSSIQDERDVGGQENFQYTDYHTHPDSWETDFETVNNVIKALWSKQQVSRMVEAAGGHDYVMYVRPDCKFYTSLDVSWFSKDTICIPNFHCFPVNDRFLIMPISQLGMMTRCFDNLLEYSKKYEVHSETYLALALHMQPIYKKKVPILFNRIRADGREEEDAWSKQGPITASSAPTSLRSAYLRFGRRAGV